VFRCDLSHDAPVESWVEYRLELDGVVSSVLHQGMRDFELRGALQEMPTVGGVSVSVDAAPEAGGGTGDTAFVCSDLDEDGTAEGVVRIRFLDRRGDVPPFRFLLPDGSGELLDGEAANRLLMAFDGEGLVRGGDGKVISSTQGKTEWLECSGRGRCNRRSGTCECFEGFTAAVQLARLNPVANCGAVVSSMGMGVG